MLVKLHAENGERPCNMCIESACFKLFMQVTNRRFQSLYNVSDSFVGRFCFQFLHFSDVDKCFLDSKFESKFGSKVSTTTINTQTDTDISINHGKWAMSTTNEIHCRVCWIVQWTMMVHKIKRMLHNKSHTIFTAFYRSMPIWRCVWVCLLCFSQHDSCKLMALLVFAMCSSMVSFSWQFLFSPPENQHNFGSTNKQKIVSKFLQLIWKKKNAEMQVDSTQHRVCEHTASLSTSQSYRTLRRTKSNTNFTTIQWLK